MDINAIFFLSVSHTKPESARTHALTLVYPPPLQLGG